KGLLQAHMDTMDLPREDGPRRIIKTRLKPGDPPKFWASADWNKVDDDVSGIEFVAYRAANILVNVVREDGERVPDDVQVSCSGEGEHSSLGLETLTKQADGRFRGSRIPPDFKVEILAGAPGFSLTTSEIMTLPEGGSREITL